MIVGTLEIQLLANLARIQADMDAAKNYVGNAMKSIETFVGYAKAALVSFIGIASVNAFKGMVQGSIEATAGLHDMAMQTGASVAALAAFRSVASTSETSIDGIAGAMNKMSKAMAGADEDSKGVGQAVKAIGLNFNDLRAMKPDEQMLAVAKALDGFQDGAGKSAVAMTLFGKEGAKMLPFLKDLADESDAVAAKMTEQQVAAKAAQAAMADDYADNLVRLQKASEGWRKDVSMALLPALFEASQAFRDVTTGAGGVKDGISKLSADGSITNWARMAITGVTYVMDVFEGLKAVVTSVGHVIGGYAALIGEQWGATGTVIAKIIKGDFAGATSEVAASFERQKSIVKDLGTTLDATWGAQTFGSKLRDRMEQLQGVAAVAKVVKENLKFEAKGDAPKKDVAEKVSDYQKLTRVIAEKQAADNLQLVTGNLLTESDKIRAKMQADLSTGSIKLTSSEIALTEAGLKKLAATELQIAAEKFYAEQGKKRFEASSALIKTAVAEAEKNEILARTFGLTREAIEQAEIAALEAQLTQKTTIGLCTAETAELEALIDAKKRNATAVASVDFQKSAADAAKKSAEEWQKGWEETDKLARDAFVGWGAQGVDMAKQVGDALNKALWSAIYEVTLKPIAFQIYGSVTGGPAGGGGALGAANSTASLMQSIGGLANAFNGAGLSGFAASNIGQSMGLSRMAADGMGPPALTDAGAAFSSLPIGAMLTAYEVGGVKGFAMGAASTAIAGGVSALAAGTSVMAGATAALSAIPVYGWAAMAALAVLGSGGGYTSAESTGYANKSYSDQGVSTGSQTTAGAAKMVDSLYAGYAQQAAALGIKQAAANFSYSSNTGREGQNPNFTVSANAGGKNYLTATDNPGLFGSMEVAMTPEHLQLEASRAIFTALQGSELPKYLKGAFDGLTASSMDAKAIADTMTSATALKTFHDQLQLLPFESLRDLSYAATQNLIVFSGGIDKLGSSLGVYYDKFYTADEKTALLTQNTRKAFEDLGQVMPAINDSTRANYRALVDELAAKDLSIAANAAAYAGVLQLASAVDQLAPAIVDTAKAAADSAKLASDAAKEASDAAQEAIATAQAAAKTRLDSVTGGASDALSALSRAVSAQKAIDQADYEAKKAIATAAFTSQSELLKSSIDSVNASLSDVGKSIGKLQSLSGTLKSTLDGMRIAGSDSTYRASAQAQISAALSTVRSGGTLPLDGQLSNALATVSKPSQQLFSSFEDYARDFYKTANDISALSGLTDAQLTADQVTQGILTEQGKTLAEQKALLKDGFDAQVSSLDAILSNAQQQLDAANGINTSVLSVAAALSQFNASILSLTAERAAQDLATSRGTTYTNDQIVASVKGALADGYSVADVYGGAAKNYGIGASTITAATSGQGIAGFDSGTAAADKYSQEQMAAWLQAAAAGGYSVADMYSHALSDYGVGGAVLSKAGKQAGLPGFAAGINYVPHDMDARIHKGEAVVPEVYNPFNPNAKAVGGGGGRTNTARLEALIEKLTEKVALLEAPAKRTAENTKKFASQFDSATEGGRAILTKAYL